VILWQLPKQQNSSKQIERHNVAKIDAYNLFEQILRIVEPAGFERRKGALKRCVLRRTGYQRLPYPIETMRMVLWRRGRDSNP
jgi:hypothetical protein